MNLLWRETRMIHTVRQLKRADLLTPTSAESLKLLTYSELVHL